MSKKTIADIQMLLDTITSEDDERFMEVLGDERKGVQKLIMRWRKRREGLEKERTQFQNMCVYENGLRSKGVSYMAGIDEVGRGPLAGPVVAAAVILPEDFYLPGLNDSKKLSETKRDQFYDAIRKSAHIGIGIVSAAEIDEINIYEATKKAMMEAVAKLPHIPEHLLIDAMKLPLPHAQTSIIKGDAKSISISAASIIAKVTRDRIMKELGASYPQYGFERHMGYGTKEHIEAIRCHGILSEHRKSFAPIKDSGMS